MKVYDLVIYNVTVVHNRIYLNLSISLEKLYFKCVYSFFVQKFLLHYCQKLLFESNGLLL